MLETYTHENMRDFGPRYLDTYGFLIKSDNQKRLIYIRENTRNAVYFNTDDDGMLFHANIDSNVMFEFIQVDRGYFTGEDSSVYYMSRIPARQWKRGISRNNTNIQKLTALGLIPQKLSLRLLAGIFGSPQTYQYADVDPTAPTVALSKHFAMTPGTVYFYATEIGTVDHTTRVLSIDPSFKVTQELNDVIRRNGFPYRVEELNA